METISFVQGWSSSPEQNWANASPTWHKALMPYLPPAMILMSLQAGALPAAAAILAHGMSTSDVAKLQDHLAHLGYFQDQSTGYFGDRTESAVRQFQEASGLAVDGVVGDQTWAALRSQATPRSVSSPEKAPPESNNWADFADLASLEINSTAAIDDPEVRDIQTRLQNLGYSPGPIDGLLGPQTEAAIREFQMARGLIVDGVVGPQTWSALEQSVTESQGLSFETLPKMQDIVFSDLGDLGAEYEILPVPELPL